MQRSHFLVLAATAAVLLSASPVAAEQYPGWYGGVDLGYNGMIDRKVVVSEAECGRRGGGVGPRRGASGPYCTIPRLSLPAAAPNGRTIRSIGDIGWFSTDRLSAEFVGACARERGQVATSGEYAFCRLPVVVRR